MKSGGHGGDSLLNFSTKDDDDDAGLISCMLRQSIDPINHHIRSSFGLFCERTNQHRERTPSKHRKRRSDQQIWQRNKLACASNREMKPLQFNKLTPTSFFILPLLLCLRLYSCCGAGGNVPEYLAVIMAVLQQFSTSSGEWKYKFRPRIYTKFINLPTLLHSK